MSPWTRAFMEHRSHFVALVVAAILAASILLPTPARATLTGFDVDIIQFEWTKLTPPPFPIVGGFAVSNTLEIKLATDTNISLLVVNVGVSDPGTGITSIQFTLRPTTDTGGYNNYQAIFAYSNEGILATDLLGPYEAAIDSILGEGCTGVGGALAICTIDGTFPVIASFSAEAVPEPSAFWLFIIGLALLLAIWVRPGSGLAGARHSSPLA